MSCSCNSIPCCCGSSPCAPANVIHVGTCTDPGEINSLAYLLGLDNRFCSRRLNPDAGGYLFGTVDGSGNFSIGFTQQPVNPLSTFTATQNIAFGQLVFIGSDNIARALTGPHVAGLVMTTNAAGAVLFSAPPVPTVPDPLTVGTINAANFTLGNGSITGALAMAGLATGTIAFTLGLDAGNNVIKGTPSITGSQCAMFFEAPTSPSPTTPNSAVIAGGLLTIGNLLFDSVLPAVSGGALFTATNSQTLTCVQAGPYIVDFCGQTVMNGNTAGAPSAQLLVNGIIVNNGNSRNIPLGQGPIRGSVAWSGFHQRQFAVGDTLQIQLGSGSGANISTYEVRIGVQRQG